MIIAQSDFILLYCIYCIVFVFAGGTLDILLSTTYCRSQMYLSKQLAQLHPELTMPMFSGKWILRNIMREEEKKNARNRKGHI